MFKLKRYLCCIISVLTLTPLLFGCESADFKKSMAPAFYWDGSFCEDGIVRVNNSDMKFPGLMCFIDYATGEEFPICNKPNCVHDDKECNAVAPEDNAFECVFLYGDNLYMICTEGVDITNIFKSNKDGSGRKKVCQINYLIVADLLGTSGIIVNDGKMYAVCDATEYLFDRNSDENKQKYVFISFDFKNEDFEVLYELPENYSSEVNKLYLANSKLYYTYNYLTEPVETVNKSGLILENILKYNFVELHSFDLETREDSLLYDNSLMFLQGIDENNIYCTYTTIEDDGFKAGDSLYAISLDDGTEKLIIQSDILIDGIVEILSDKIICRSYRGEDRSSHHYDKDGNLIKALSNPASNIRGDYGDYYYLWIGDFNSGFAKKDDYEADPSNYHILR